MKYPGPVAAALLLLTIPASAQFQGPPAPYLNNSVTAGGASNPSFGSVILNGATSGSVTLKAPAIAGSNTLTFPAGTTDFSATGGTSQVVKQTSVGGALTVAQLACADLSNSSAACSSTTGLTLTTTTLAGATTLPGSGGAIGTTGLIYAGALGTTAAVAFGSGSNVATGMFFPNANQVSLCGNTSCGLTVNGVGLTTAALSLNLGSGSYQMGAKPLFSTTAPTIASGGCTTGSAQTVSASNGSAAFAITLGGATCGNTITLTMPAASAGWVCDAHDITTPATSTVEQSAGGSTTVVTFTRYVRTTGVAGAFTAADVLAVHCTAY